MSSRTTLKVLCNLCSSNIFIRALVHFVLIFRAPNYVFLQRTHCPASPALWILSARVEENAGQLIKARSLLEKARQRNPGVPELWLEAIRVENRAGLKNVAQSLMAKGNFVTELCSN
jgi:hypothetical protein